MAERFELGYDGPTTLVVGVDGSDTATRALYYALGLGRRQRCSVIAVYAMTTPAGYDGAMDAAAGQASLEVAAELKPRIEALAADYHVTTTFVAVAGDPVL
jgi:nucleotide-binding universal stress UspA family protein